MLCQWKFGINLSKSKHVSYIDIYHDTGILGKRNLCNEYLFWYQNNALQKVRTACIKNMHMILAVSYIFHLCIKKHSVLIKKNTRDSHKWLFTVLFIISSRTWMSECHGHYPRSPLGATCNSITSFIPWSYINK